MLSEHEQHRLAEIESVLNGEDPAFVGRFEQTRLERFAAPRRWVALLLGAVGATVAVVGLGYRSVPVVVLAMCGVGVAGGVWTWPMARRVPRPR